MKYRKLRIAWSVGWGAVAVLLCVLWVFSYWWDVFADTPTIAIRITSRHGQFGFIFSFEQLWEDGIWNWDVFPTKIDENYDRIDLDPEISIPTENVLIVRGFHWQLVVAASVIANLVWLPLERFSLRTLLIATTLIAVGLWLIVWSSGS